MPIHICVTCPAPPGSRQGNRISAVRWARILRSLGHRVTIVTGRCRRLDADLLLALHARRSASAIASFRREHPERPIILVLTGTDLYHDLARSRPARRSLELADRLVVLQPLALRRLSAAARRKARVIHQSVVRPKRPGRREERHFEVCVLSHLRAVKDPLRAARSARLLPAESKVRIVHAGRALSAALARQARAEMARNPRYRWLGERSHRASLQLLARSRALVISSALEGGANAVGEAAVCGVPVLASRVDGNVGLLGPSYPGYFPAGDTKKLARMLERLESDPHFYARLRRRTARIAAHFAPAREQAAWRSLLATLPGLCAQASARRRAAGKSPS